MTNSKMYTVVFTGRMDNDEGISTDCVFIAKTDSPHDVARKMEDIVTNGDCTILMCKSPEHAHALATLITNSKFKVSDDGSLVGDDSPESQQAAQHWNAIVKCLQNGSTN